MRVDILATPSQPTGETTAKTAESENDSAGAFFAEIDRVLNMGTQEGIQEGIQREEKESEQSSDASESSDLNLFLSSFLFSMQHAEIKSVPQINLPDSSSSPTQPEGESENVAAAAVATAVAENANPAIASAGSPENPNCIIETKADESASAQGLFERGLVSLKSKAISDQSGVHSDALADFAANQKKAKNGMELNVPQAKKEIAQSDASAAGVAENNRLQQSMIEQASLMKEQSQAAASRFDAMATPDRFISANKNNSSTDPISSRNEKSWNGIFEKLDAAVQGAFKEMDMGGSHSDQGSGSNEFPALMALQNKLESSDFKNAKTAISDNSRENISTIASGMERPAIANNTVSSAEPTAPSKPGELIYQLAEKIQVQIRDGKGEMRIQLKPENLGSLEIRAASTSNGVVAHITAESNRVKSYLENNLHILQQTLQDQGLKVDRLQVTVQEVFDPQQGSGQSAQFGNADSGNQGREAPKPVHPTESALPITAEEIAGDPMSFIAGVRSRFHTVA
jgi:flagellar hook-length control protein FliK